jgi:hypothetical protein
LLGYKISSFHLMVKILPNFKCLITGNLPRTSTLNIFIIPYATLSQFGTPLISLSIGDDSPNGTPFLTSLMKQTHPKYM